MIDKAVKQYIKIDEDTPSIKVEKSEVEIILPKLNSINLPKGTVFTLVSNENGYLRAKPVTPDNFGIQGERGPAGGSLAYKYIYIGDNETIKYTGKPIELTINYLLQVITDYNKLEYPGGLKIVLLEGSNSSEPIRIILQKDLPNKAQGIELEVINLSSNYVSLLAQKNTILRSVNEDLLIEDNYVYTKFNTTVGTGYIRRGAVVNVKHINVENIDWVINSPEEVFYNSVNSYSVSRNRIIPKYKVGAPRSTNFTLSNNDNLVIIPCVNTTNIIITLPFGLEDNTQLIIDRQSTGEVYFDVADGVTLKSSSAAITKVYGIANCIYNSIERYWRIYGDV